MDPRTKLAITEAIDAGAAIARAVAPQFTAYIVLGAMLAKAAPDLYQDVLNLLQKRDPTAEDKAELARKLHALANPEAS